MAAFIETGIDYSRIDDLPYMKRYIMMLNDDLRYMFNNLDPADNFSEDGLTSYLELDEQISDINLSLDKLNMEFTDTKESVSSGLSQMSDSISLYVETGDVTNQINLSDGIISINAPRLHVTSENFTVNDTQLMARGEIVATGGSIGAFQLVKDASGKEYLQGGTGSKISSGQVYGSKGEFGSLECTNGTVVMTNDTWYMWNCRIQSSGLEFTGAFEAGAMDIARYDAENDVYTAWYPLTCHESIYADEIHVGRNWDDSGQVRCYSVYSYFEGAEKPDPYGDEFSDRRLKRNIFGLSEQMAAGLIEKIKPVSYRLIGDDRDQLGVIAQDLQEACEEIGEDFGLISSCDGYMTVGYTRLIPVIAAALRWTREEIDKWQSTKAG